MADEVKITVQKDGPYVVEGGVPLVRKTPVMSEHGEPMTWQKHETLTSRGRYSLCRCGESSIKPFCDGSHTGTGFNGTETADPGPIENREKTFEGEGITVTDDHSLCMHAGFCGTRLTNIWKMLGESDESTIRAQIMSMVEKCPSGTLSFLLESGGPKIEPDLPVEIAVLPDGALWVSGSIPVERADGLDFERRNRVTLCRCGSSKNKPYCDGTHKDTGFKDD